MRRLLLATAAVLCVVGRGAEGYGIYQDKIPNGDSVPSPCNPNVIWRGVGHLTAQGGGIRNKFGLDFAAANHTWTRELCKKDSDGDGRTNGQELGDPNCTWTAGTLPLQRTGITLPAVCEPVDNDSCKNKLQEGSLYSTQEDWLAEVCKSGTFNCPATDEPDVEHQTFRIEPTQVPARETTYMCQRFRVANVSHERHMIATRAIINNTNVMHHMLLFGCDGNTQVTDSPYPCGMFPGPTCTSIISGWTLGLEGECFNNMSGVRVGPGGYKVLALQYHWNNPTKESSFTDSSGMEMFFTATLRQHDSAVAMFGQEYIVIPPYSTGTEVTAQCTETCVKELVSNKGINITYGINHMHYLGVSQTVEQYRNGEFLRNITNDVVYNYDSPRTYEFDPPVEVLPGDRIVTRCHYKSPKRNKTTFFGEGTSEEMCYAFFTFYPAENGPRRNRFCVAEQSRLSCDPATQTGCDISNFIEDFNNTEVYRNITTRCLPFSPCTVECKEAILTARASDPCLSHEPSWNKVLRDFSDRLRIFLSYIASCQVEVYLEENPDATRASTTSPTLDCESTKGGADLTTSPKRESQTGGADNMAYSFKATIAVILICLILIG